jgi:hypothetical protein
MQILRGRRPGLITPCGHANPVGELGIISMINSRILNMTILATNTCNSNILDVLNNKMNGNK